MDARARCKLVLDTLRPLLEVRGIPLSSRDNRLVNEDEQSFAYLGFSPCKYSTADTTRRFVEIALRSTYLDGMLYHPDTYKSRYVATSCLIHARIPTTTPAWELTDEQSCITAAHEIARHTADRWTNIIDAYRTEPAMLALISRCPIDPSRTHSPNQYRAVDTLQLAAIGYLLHKLNLHRELDTFITLLRSKYTSTPYLHPQGTLQTCLDIITK
ncbi:MAG: hypothetical protein CMJ35_01230 [Phycisphaerae bacterium]|nr:hypothetical protein [Phycisphaerae bacterium]